MKSFAKPGNTGQKARGRAVRGDRFRRRGLRIGVERLEVRRLLVSSLGGDSLDIGPSTLLTSLAPGQLGWLGASGISNDLHVSVTPGGKYTITDTKQIILLGSNALSLGWTGSGTTTVTGPDSTVSSLLLDGQGPALGGPADSYQIDSIDDPLTFQPNAFGGGSQSTPETVTIGNSTTGVQGILGSVTVTNPSGLTALTIDNSGDATGRTATIDSNVITGLAPQPINYTQTQLSSLGIKGGLGGSTYTVAGTPSSPSTNVPTTLTTNAAGDVVKITGTSANSPHASLTVTGQAANTVDVGTGSTRGINGVVSVSNSSHTTTLNVDDSADATGRTVSIQTSGLVSLITGITAQDTISWSSGDVPSLAVSTGSGDDTVTENLPSVSGGPSGPPTLNLTNLTINTGGGNDAVDVQQALATLTTNIDTGIGAGDAINIGSSAPTAATSVLSTIQGPVKVTDSGGGSTLNVSDANDSSPQTWNLTATQITGGGLGAPITYDSSATTVNLFGGFGGNTFIVQDTDGGSNTTINSGTGDDTAFVLATTGPLTIDGRDGFDLTFLGTNDSTPGSPGTVQNIRGQVTVRKTGSGSMDAIVDDSSNGAAVNATLAVNPATGFAELTGQAPAAIRYLAAELDTLPLDSGPGGETLNLDFANGNPIPTGPTTFGLHGLLYTGRGTSNRLSLLHDLPAGPFHSEDSVASGPGAGTIDFFDPALNPSHIDYSGLSPVDDTTSVVNYTFGSPLSSAQNVQLLDTAVNGFNGTRIVETGGAFERQDISNKQNVTVNIGSPSSSPAAADTVLINNPGAASGAHSLALQNLAVNTFAGNDTITVTAVPAIPDASVSTNGGNDTVNVAGGGVASGTTLSLDGGLGSDVLHYDASGAAVAVSPGSSPGEIIISGPNGTVDALNFEQVVITNGAPTPPVFSLSTIVINSVEDSAITNQLVASFHSAAPGAKPSDFTAVIDWGDGSATPGSIVQDISDPTLFDVFGSHTYVEEGTFAIRTTASSSGSTGTTTVNSTPVTVVTSPSGPVGPTQTAQALVADAPLIARGGVPVSATEGAPTANLPLGRFTDTNPVGTLSDFFATIDWGDGTPRTSGVVTAIPGLPFQVSGSHTYAEEGSFPITITVTDVGGQRATITTTATVADAPLTSSGTNVAGTEGLSTGNVTVATFTDADPAGTVGDYTATVNWGDGTATVTLPAGSITSVVLASGVTFHVDAAHTYAEEGTFRVTVTVADAGGSSTLSTTQAVIGDAPLTNATGVHVAATEGAALTDVPVATFVDSDPLGTTNDFTGTIDWGDGSTSQATITQPGGAGTPFTVSGSHPYTEEGSYQILITIHDTGGQATSFSSSATVADAPLSSQGFTIGFTQLRALPDTTVVAHFSDADPNGMVSDYSATINWGDNTTPSMGTIVPSPSGGFDVQGGHTYAVSGARPISVVIVDTLGGASTTAQGSASIQPLRLVVTNTLDNLEEGSLRRALADAVLLGGTSPQTIFFEIPTPGPYIVHLQSPLTVTVPVRTDTAGLHGAKFVLDGGSTVGNGSAIGITPGTSSARAAGLALLDVQAPDSIIQGLGFIHSAGYGIALDDGSGRDQLLDDVIGSDETGTVARGNKLGGVFVLSAHNTIGLPGHGNIISANGTGIVFSGSGATNNVVQSNRIGTNARGTGALGNTQDGIDIDGASHNLIGGSASGQGNIIAANGPRGAGSSQEGGAGIYVFDGSSHNVIQGNRIGLTGLGNHSGGVLIGGSGANLVGGTTPGSGNTIAGNLSSGIVIFQESAGNMVAGNTVVRNANAGVYILNSSRNVIGLRGAANNLSGNAFSGVVIAVDTTSSSSDGSATATGNVVRYNAIRENHQDGIYLFNASRNAIGGPNGAGNQVQLNGFSGLEIAGQGATGNVVLGNLIADQSRASLLAPIFGPLSYLRGGYGALIQNATGNVIGTPGAGNVLRNNTLGNILVVRGGRPLPRTDTGGNVIGGNTSLQGDRAGILGLAIRGGTQPSGRSTRRATRAGHPAGPLSHSRA